MSPEAERTLPGNALTTTATSDALLVLAPKNGGAVLDDLGPAVCPTCGSLQLDAMDPLRAVSGVLLSLLASVLGLVGLCATIAGLIVIARDGPGPFLLGLATGAGGGLAGYSAHRVARRTARHQTVCRVCGESEGRWTSTSSDAGGVLATLFSGPLLLPGLGLLALALATVGTFPARQVLTCGTIGVGLVALAMLIIRRPWTSSRGTDWASGGTLGRLFLSGQGVGTNPVLRRLDPSEPPAKGLLSAEETIVADDLVDLVARGVVSLESRDDIVWSRILSYHRLTIVPAALHARWEPTSTLGHDETPLAERIVAELRAEAAREDGGARGDYRGASPEAPTPQDEPRGTARLPLLELLARVGVGEASARAVEGALRASIRPHRLTSRQYVALRGGARTLVVRKVR